jgi:hypothetical protein
MARARRQDDLHSVALSRGEEGGEVAWHGVDCRSSVMAWSSEWLTARSGLGELLSVDVEAGARNRAAERGKG